MKLSIKSKQTVRRLLSMLENEHICGCDSDGCDINVAFQHGYGLWAVYLFDSSGAASDEFTALYATLPKSFYRAARAEADHMCDAIAHSTCPKCNAVTWHNDEHGDVIHCDSCLASYSIESAS